MSERVSTPLTDVVQAEALAAARQQPVLKGREREGERVRVGGRQQGQPFGAGGQGVGGGGVVGERGLGAGGPGGLVWGRPCARPATM